MAEVGAIQLCIDHALDEGSSDDAEGGAFQLAALLARLSAAERERDTEAAKVDELLNIRTDLREALDRAEARVEAAERALREIAGREPYITATNWMQATARAALAGREEQR